MAMPDVVNVAQSREVSVHRVEQPEACDVRCREICETRATLATSAREDAAFRGENLDQSPGDAHQVVVGCDIQQRRNVLRIKAKGARASSLNARDLQRIASLSRLALNQKSQIFSRDLHRFFRQA